MVIDDESGVRELKGTSYSVSPCSTSRVYTTGVQFAGNYTLMGLSSTLGTHECVRKEISGNLVIEDMQAIVIETNGWFIEPHSIDIDDIDSQVGVPLNEAWKDLAIVFGVHEESIVVPELQLSADTNLQTGQYVIPQEVMEAVGLKLGESRVPGAEFAAGAPFNCPYGKNNTVAKRCRLTAKFNAPVEKLVFFYGLSQSSLTSTDSAVFISELNMQCGCRCVSGDAGVRELSLPIEGSPEQCSRVQTTSPRTECDVLGKQWCRMENSFAYKISGEKLPNGQFPCTVEPSFTARVLTDFNPEENFNPAI